MKRENMIVKSNRQIFLPRQKKRHAQLLDGLTSHKGGARATGHPDRGGGFVSCKSCAGVPMMTLQRGSFELKGRWGARPPTACKSGVTRRNIVFPITCMAVQRLQTPSKLRLGLTGSLALGAFFASSCPVSCAVRSPFMLLCFHQHR